MKFDIAPFLELLFGNMKDEKISSIYYIVPLIAVLIFFAIRDFLLVNKEVLRENKKSIIADFMLDIIASMVLSVCCFYLVKNLLVSILCGILFAIYLTPKISSLSNKTKSKAEGKATTTSNIPSTSNIDNNSSINNSSSSNNTNNNNVNVVINNNVEDSKEEENNLLPDFYEPSDLKLPEGITSPNQLNIIMILEMYRYISPNQKFKMISQSIFETTDEQIEMLLKMYALEENELKEAKAILNLIKLNNRLVTKEEALHCILEYEKKQAEKNKN